MDAIRKMTLMPAEVLERSTPAGHQKGRVQEGADADIVVVDTEEHAAEIVDRSVAAPTLSVNSRNVALVTYSVHGTQRHVLYWGGVDWADSFKRDYSGGWKSKMADYKRFIDGGGVLEVHVLELDLAAQPTWDHRIERLRDRRRRLEQLGDAADRHPRLLV